MNFFDYDFDIKNIVLACYVGKGNGSNTHINRPSHGIAFNLGGEKTYIFKSGEKIKIKKNDIIYLPKYSDYIVKVKEGSDCFAINFDFFTDITFPPFAIHAKSSSAIIELFKDSEIRWRNKSTSYILKCKANLYNILYLLKKEYLSGYIPKDKYKIIEPAFKYIHNNYTTEILSVASLSKMCNITPEYFRTIFSKLYGVSPIKYINNLKITRAKELLDSGLYTVTDAAFLSGYNDISHFSREFKKMYFVSPSEYKKNT